MKILITGGLGHIGSYLTRNLLKELPISEITIVDSLQTQRFSSLFNMPLTPKIEFIEKKVADLNTTDIMRNRAVDCVVHLAATTDASGNLDNSEALFKNNLGSTTAMTDLCGSLEIPLIFPSSTSVYGSQSDLVDESCVELVPQSPYAECKLQEEALIGEAVRKGLKGTILRFGTIHGISEGMRFHTAVNRFCFQTANNVPLTVWKTALNQKRPYLSLVDANRAIGHVIQNSVYCGGIYNVLTNNHTVRDIIDAIELATGKKCEINFVDNAIMNQLSYEVSSKKFEATGFEFHGNLISDVSNTMSLLSGISNE
jgi:nucleoside-diphosphate-sugar epimerase